MSRVRTFGAGVAATWLVTGAPAVAQRLGQAGGADISIWRVVGALAICLLLAGGAAFALRMRLRGRALPRAGDGRSLQLVESLRLSHQIDLCLVRSGEREFIVAATPHGATLIAPAGIAPGADGGEA